MGCVGSLGPKQKSWMWSAGNPSRSHAVPMQSGCLRGVPLRGGMRLGPRASSLKNTSAAVKMVFLAAGSTPGGGGKGRGVRLVGILIGLSLVMCGTQSLSTEIPRKYGSESSMDECGKRTQVVPVAGDGGLSTYQAPEECLNGTSRYCWKNGTWVKLCELETGTWCINPEAGLRNGQSNDHGFQRKKRDMEQMSIPICDQCNQTMWVGGKTESIFIAYHQVNPLCYDSTRLGICTINGKMYWVTKNTKFDNKITRNKDPFILDLAQANDDSVCLQYDRVVCGVNNKDDENPEGKIKEIIQEMKRRESELRKRRIEQERLKTLSEQYEALEKQYADGELPSPDRNLFIDLIQEIATELGLSNCWICGGLKSAEKWPWKGEGLAPEHLQKWDSPRVSKLVQRPEGWALDQRVISSICVSQKGREYTEMVGYTSCVSTLTVNSDSKSKVWLPAPPLGIGA